MRPQPKLPCSASRGRSSIASRTVTAGGSVGCSSRQHEGRQAAGVAAASTAEHTWVRQTGRRFCPPEKAAAISKHHACCEQGIQGKQERQPSGSRQPAHVACHHQALPATAVTLAALPQGVVHARVQWQHSCSTIKYNQCSLRRSMLLKALFRPRRAWAALGCFATPPHTPGMG
jgi:hypothetical protein